MCGCGGSGVDGMGEKEKEKADTLHSSKRSCLYFPVFFFFFLFLCQKSCRFKNEENTQEILGAIY